MHELRYVVLRHEGIAEPHFDLMFETAPESALTTWRSNAWPLPADAILTKLADHRRAYLDYEGPVSGNRGFVRRVSAGTYELLSQDDRMFEAMLNDSSVPLRLRHDRQDQWRVPFDTDGNSTRHG